MLDFKDVIAAAPKLIRADDATFLKPQKYDLNHHHESYTADGSYLTGSPLTYKSAAPISAFYAIVDLWTHVVNAGQDGGYIKVNLWTFQVCRNGVTSADGIFTKLRPEGK